MSVVLSGTHVIHRCVQWLMRISAFLGSFKTCGAWVPPPCVRFWLNWLGCGLGIQVWFFVFFFGFILSFQVNPLHKSGLSSRWCRTWVWELETEHTFAQLFHHFAPISVRWKLGRRATAAKWPRSQDLHPWRGTYRCGWVEDATGGVRTIHSPLEVCGGEVSLPWFIPGFLVGWSWGCSEVFLKMEGLGADTVNQLGPASFIRSSDVFGT